MRRRLALAIIGLLLTAQVRADAVTDAFDGAIAAFERARPSLAQPESGVDLSAYRDALTLRRFASNHWGGTVLLAVVNQTTANGECGRFAAFVRMPPDNGSISLVLCPQFSSAGTDGLRVLTILHELVHVVAGPDECRAMAFAARIEQAAFGQFTDVSRYWQANGCAGSRFSLP
ncbi:MAG: hypothetical protein KIT02_13905 [Devosia sp.]|uniref:hypothetical protein n=1 Tax=Devosia sp. TaxID=1871048 RepID=UPI0024CA2C23|nr:hypothetical protein [Devosia sp.]UYN99011.1 MAG: hypothetical protein KIT02_13905 [Devosia sp.]